MQNTIIYKGLGVSHHTDYIGCYVSRVGGIANLKQDPTAAEASHVLPIWQNARLNQVQIP
jgi:hypothetical protein